MVSPTPAAADAATTTAAMTASRRRVDSSHCGSPNWAAPKPATISVAAISGLLPHIQ
ncbi:hypothetical protein [Corynebacterium glyciniphilum]|uniref:hypothetical protein n=1 Tax=Corynebacterium glyciniphilum TaxID=1404244 RepID=UPI003FD1F65D